MGNAATPVLPAFTAQQPSAYKANIDAGFAVLDRIAWAFAPHEQATPDMRVRVEPGFVFVDGVLTEVPALNSPTIAAPTTNPRIDRIAINPFTGGIQIAQGTESATPSPPAIPSGRLPIAQVLLSPGQTQIFNSDITDERTWVPFVVTSFATTLLNDADSTAARNTLGLGTADSPTFTGLTLSANLVTTSTLDGRDVSVDGAKLDGIEAGAEVNNGELRSIQTFTTTGANTYIKSAGLIRAKVELVGGGGGSGGCAATGAGQLAAAAGGGAGGYAVKLLEASTIGATETVTVGPGGAAGAAGNNAGGAGGTSSFGALLSATGGGGGGGSPAVATANRPLIGGANGGAGSGGNINIKGTAGGLSMAFDSNRSVGGSGGASALGGGVQALQTITTTKGITGSNFGGGASGSANSVNQAATAGSAGAPGIVIVWEYF